jgi:cysteine-rich repeat protein
MVCLLLLLSCSTHVRLAEALDPCLSLPASAGPSSLELPACGNGVLDPGEVCDDGNRVGGDGCNAWCSGFDRMTRACTMAGQNPFYASAAAGDQRQSCLSTMMGRSTFGPSQARFCNLNALAAAPDGKYLVVAEGGLLVKMELFTDSFASSLSFLPATVIQPLARVCSLAILPTGVIVVHECQAQSIVLLLNEGAQLSTPFTMPLLQPQHAQTALRSYLDEDLFLVAGVPHSTPNNAAAASCVHVYSFNVASGSGALLASIDCIVYNVIEKGLIYPSFSIAGMVPYQITKEGCPFQMQAALCYVVHMQRADMQVLKAYLAADGGLDIQYTVSTDDAVNVLGAPLIAQSPRSGNKYTLTGNCFTMQQHKWNRMDTIKQPPPMVALGNTCGPMPFQPNAAQCSTPLNNPFITDVASSSYLLPLGLSSTHQHQTLLNIFTGAHVALYKQILDNTHNGTVPIDFVELPGTLDVVYITRTTIGLISTKGLVHMDLFHPGYCRATPAIKCPKGFFGSVSGGVCEPCVVQANGEVDASVSAQIQCAGLIQEQQRRRRRRNLLGASAAASSFQSAPYTHMGLIVTKDVTRTMLDELAKYYLVMKGQNCTNAEEVAADGSMTAHEPYNMLADYSEAQQPLPQSQLITTLIANASKRDKRDYAAQAANEYLIGWTHQETAVIDAVSAQADSTVTPPERLQHLVQTCGVSSELIAALENSTCRRIKMNSNFHRFWLPCALSVASTLSSSSTRNATQARSLLQSTGAAPSAIIEHSQCTFMSSTTVTYNAVGFNANDKPGTLSKLGTPSPGAGAGASTDANGNMWLILGGIGGGLLVSGLVVLVLYCYCIAGPSSSASTRVDEVGYKRA